MSKLKFAHNRVDQLNEIHAKHVRSAGLKIGRVVRGSLALPTNLDALHGLAERQLYEDVAQSLVDEALAEGRPIFWGTVCHPGACCPADELEARLIKRTRDWVSRRGRRLRTEGLNPLLVGAVDVAWNKRTLVRQANFWCSHSHFLVTTANSGWSAATLHARLKDAFHCPDDPTGRIVQTIHFKQIKTAEDARVVASYFSGSMVLHDPTGQRRHRRKRVSYPDGRMACDMNLRPRRQAEVTKLFIAIGPAGFPVLCGYRRRADRVVREFDGVTVATKTVPRRGFSVQPSQPKGHRNGKPSRSSVSTARSSRAKGSHREEVKAIMTKVDKVISECWGKPDLPAAQPMPRNPVFTRRGIDPRRGR